jgi:hypothetical protein
MRQAARFLLACCLLPVTCYLLPGSSLLARCSLFACFLLVFRARFAPAFADMAAAPARAMP